MNVINIKRKEDTKWVKAREDANSAQLLLKSL